MRAPTMALALAGLAMAGCLSSETQITVDGRNPLVSHGYGWDGDVTPSEGFLTLRAVDESNTGRLEAGWSDGGAWSLNWTTFAEAPDKPYQDGGIVVGLDAHGNTTRGDANLPLVRYLAAGWGRATLSKDGQPFEDPLTGSTTMSAHFMALEAAVRHPDSKKITKRDGATAYDPTMPDDGMTHAGRSEVLLLLQSTQPSQPAREIAVSGLNGSVENDPNYSREHKFDVPQNVSRVRLEVRLTNPDPWVGQLTLRLYNAKNVNVANGTLGGIMQDNSENMTVARSVTPGVWTLTVTGGAARMDYSASGTLTIPPRTAFVRLLSFDDASISLVGPRAP